MGAFLFSMTYFRRRHVCGFTIGTREGAQQRSTYRNLAVGHESDNRSSHHKTASNAAQLRVWLLAQLYDQLGAIKGPSPSTISTSPIASQID
ncbi:hypothetical protein VCR29J2_730028 [Vibrio coralliirubri]|nr:hypothetical protein VCR29J2_730028 [Vibrio coralliirubri]